MDASQPGIDPGGRQRQLKRWLCVGVTAAFVLAIVLVQVSQVARLKRKASSIKAGDTKSEVIALLGTPSMEVTYAQTIRRAGSADGCLCYGGWLNVARAYVDVRACTFFAKRSLYRCADFVCPDAGDWPLRVELDDDDTVMAVLGG